MTDFATPLEAELCGMQPSPLRQQVARRIETELAGLLAHVSPWPDRFLLAAISSGALAACVLATALLAGMTESSAPGGPVSAGTFSAHPAASGATPLAFAHGDASWVDLLK
jgi:hypothetical protein